MGGRDQRVHQSRGSLGQSETRAGGSANFCKLVLGLHGTCAEEATLQSGQQLRAEQGRAGAGAARQGAGAKNCRAGRGLRGAWGVGLNRPCRHRSLWCCLRESEDGGRVGLYER